MKGLLEIGKPFFCTVIVVLDIFAIAIRLATVSIRH